LTRYIKFVKIRFCTSVVIKLLKFVKIRNFKKVKFVEFEFLTYAAINLLAHSLDIKPRAPKSSHLRVIPCASASMRRLNGASVIRRCRLQQPQQPAQGLVFLAPPCLIIHTPGCHGNVKRRQVAYIMRRRTDGRKLRGNARQGGWSCASWDACALTQLPLSSTHVRHAADSSEI